MVARNANQNMMTPMVEYDGICVWRESGDRVFAGAFRRNVAKNVPNVVDSMRIVKIMLQQIILLFSTKRLIPVNFSRSCAGNL
jgi:hypothetical protein